MYTGCGLIRRKVGLGSTILVICEIMLAHLQYLMQLAMVAFRSVDMAHACTYAMIMGRVYLMLSSTS